MLIDLIDGPTETTICFISLYKGVPTLPLEEYNKFTGKKWVYQDHTLTDSLYETVIIDDEEVKVTTLKFKRVRKAV